MATLFVDKLDPQSGTALEIGSSGDTITIPSGATITNSGTATGFGGITMGEQWRLTANKTSSGVLDANLEVVDTAGYGTLGTGMSQSSGIFTFPATGFYMVIVNATFRGNSENSMSVFFDVTTDNTNYNTIAAADNGQRNGTDTNVGAGCSSIIDVTDTSNVKVRFQSSSIASGSYVYGNTDTNNTSFMFVRLGDT